MRRRGKHAISPDMRHRAMYRSRTDLEEDDGATSHEPVVIENSDTSSLVQATLVDEESLGITEAQQVDLDHMLQLEQEREKKKRREGQRKMKRI